MEKPDTKDRVEKVFTLLKNRIYKLDDNIEKIREKFNEEKKDYHIDAINAMTNEAFFLGLILAEVEEIQREIRGVNFP